MQIVNKAIKMAAIPDARKIHQLREVLCGYVYQCVLPISNKMAERPAHIIGEHDQFLWLNKPL